MKISILLLLVTACLFAVPSAHATTCTNNTYHNFTCKAIVNVTPGNCGTAFTNIVSVTTGDTILIWNDNVGTAGTNQPSGMTDGGNTYTQISTNLIATFDANINNVWESVWTAVSTRTGNISPNLACSGGTPLSEISVLVINSSVGTPSVDCTSTWATVNSTSISSNCISTGTNDLAFCVIDWNNLNPTEGAGWTALHDSGSEFVWELQSETTPGTVTGTWTTASNDFKISGTIVFRDTSSTANSKLVGSMKLLGPTRVQ